MGTHAAALGVAPFAYAHARRHAGDPRCSFGTDTRVADLQVWRVGRRQLAAIASVVTRDPRDPSHDRAMLARFPDVAHVTVEVNGRGSIRS